MHNSGATSDPHAIASLADAWVAANRPTANYDHLQPDRSYLLPTSQADYLPIALINAPAGQSKLILIRKRCGDSGYAHLAVCAPPPLGHVLKGFFSLRACADPPGAVRTWPHLHDSARGERNECAHAKSGLRRAHISCIGITLN